MKLKVPVRTSRRHTHQALINLDHHTNRFAPSRWSITFPLTGVAACQNRLQMIELLSRVVENNEPFFQLTHVEPAHTYGQFCHSAAPAADWLWLEPEHDPEHGTVSAAASTEDLARLAKGLGYLA